MSSFHIAIVGAGVAGLASAFEFAQQGHQVSVIAPQNDPFMATSAAMGVISIKAQVSARSPLFALKMQGHAEFRAWVDRIAAAAQYPISCHQGIYEAYADSEGHDKILQRVFHGKPRPEQPVLTIQAHEKPILKAFYPSCLGSFYYEQDLWVDGPEFIATLERYLRTHPKVEFVDNMVTKCVEKNAKAVSLLLAKDQAQRSFDYVILACGHGSPQILAASGFEDFCLGRIFGEMWGVSVTFPHEAPESFAMIFGKQTFISHNGRAWFGAIDFKNRPTNEQIKTAQRELLSKVRELGLLRQNVESTHSLGSRLFSSDRGPLVGPLSFSALRPSQAILSPDRPSESRLFLNTAHHKSGFVFAATCARMLSSYILHQREEGFLRDFSPMRFFPISTALGASKKSKNFQK